ncbi:hypothetical protein OROGR_026831 [Orobanche gracilis]
MTMGYNLHDFSSLPRRTTDSITWKSLATIASIVSQFVQGTTLSLFWTPSTSGEFTLASAYESVLSKRSVLFPISRFGTYVHGYYTGDGEIRDHERRIIAAFVLPLAAKFVVEAEVFALYFALQWCLREALAHVLVEVDDLPVVSYLQAPVGKCPCVHGS